MPDHFVSRTMTAMIILAMPFTGAIYAAIPLGTGTLQSLLSF